MGPVRGGLTALLAVSPASAMASVCAELHADWDGAPVSSLSEATSLFASPLSLILLAATIAAVWARSQWGALAVCVLWSAHVSLIAFFDTTGGVRQQAIAEGCVGSPTVFIAAVAALCVAMILRTAPRARAD